MAGWYPYYYAYPFQYQYVYPIYNQWYEYYNPWLW